MDRIAALNEVLTENPQDAFARYGLAMEYSKAGDFDRALAEFSILLESHPEYTAGYFMAAQTLVRAERVDDAKKMLNQGIESARRTGSNRTRPTEIARRTATAIANRMATNEIGGRSRNPTLIASQVELQITHSVK